MAARYDSSYSDSCQSSRSCSPSVETLSDDEDCPEEQGLSSLSALPFLVEFNFLRSCQALMASLDKAATAAQNASGSDINKRATQLRETLDGVETLSAVVGEMLSALNRSFNSAIARLTEGCEELQRQAEKATADPQREQCAEPGLQSSTAQTPVTSSPIGPVAPTEPCCKGQTLIATRPEFSTTLDSSEISSGGTVKGGRDLQPAHSACFREAPRTPQRLAEDDPSTEALLREAHGMLLQLAHARDVTGPAVRPESPVSSDPATEAHPREAMSILPERSQAGPSSVVSSEPLAERALGPASRQASPCLDTHCQLDIREALARHRPSSPYEALRRQLAARPAACRAFRPAPVGRGDDEYSDSLDSSYHSPPRPASEASEFTEFTLDSNDISLADSGYASPGSGFSDSSSVSGDFDNIRLGQASPGIPLAARPASPGPPHREEDESDSVSEFLSDVDDTLSTGERQCIARKRRRDSDDSDCSESDLLDELRLAKMNRQSRP